MDESELVTLVTKPGCPGVSWRGEWYPASNDRVKVPAGAVVELTHWIHGNKLAPVEAPQHRVAQTLHINRGKRA